MTIKRLPGREAFIMDSLAAKMSEGRDGKHLTSAVYCNVKAFGAARLMAAGYEAPRPDPGATLRMAIGVGLGDVIEQGHMAQMTVGSADDDSVGTIDILYKGKVVEIKCTWQSSNKSPDENAHWMEQTGGYAARWMKPDAKSVTAEFWVIHLGGDGGAMYCPAHGRPERKVHRFYEPTQRKRMVCPECSEFLVPGNREPEVRCWEKTWPAEELRSLHKIQTARQAQLAEDIANPDYQIGGELPPIQWGFQAEFECKGCTMKERIGCPGIEGQDDLEAQLQGSIFNIQREKEKTHAS